MGADQESLNVPASWAGCFGKRRKKGGGEGEKGEREGKRAVVLNEIIENTSHKC